MSTTKLVVSDLHLADGSALDGFGNHQQSAFEGLLHAASYENGLRGQADTTELIINGDCFDFLVTLPYTSQKTTSETTALLKLEKIIAAHGPFFAALHTFVSVPGHTITFIAGNHDLELCFAAVQTRICAAITGQPTDPRLHFCPTRFYRPLPDVYIEHGNHYDFWNHATEGLWDENGQPLGLHSQTITTSVGSWYFQSGTYPISTRYAYFDHFEPSINHTRQIALLCLLDPDLIIEIAQHTMQMLSYPRQSHSNLTQAEMKNPVRLFEESIGDFMAFRDDMVAQKRDWTAQIQHPQVSPEDIMEFTMLREALALPRDEAVAAICKPVTYQMGESVATGMCAVLHRDPTLRYAIAGHTHMVRLDPIDQSDRAYLNTASWTKRLALPTPDEITPDLVNWLQAPDWNDVPLHDVTQYLFALITTRDDGSAKANLCVWEGDVHGSYRILAHGKK